MVKRQRPKTLQFSAVRVNGKPHRCSHRKLENYVKEACCLKEKIATYQKIAAGYPTADALTTGPIDQALAVMGNPCTGLGVWWRGTWKPLDVLLALTAQVRDALASEERTVALHYRLNGAM